jgi:hypothetical protein
MIEYTKERQSTFVDLQDWYTSFLFNLLAESIQIRTYSIDLATYQADEDWESFQETLANLMRVCLDFESSFSQPYTLTSDIRRQND